MDELIQIAAAIAADLESVRDQLGVPFDVERSYLPTWDVAQQTQQQNEKPKVFVAPIAEEGEQASRSDYTRRPTVQIVVGAMTGPDRGRVDQIVTLGAAIARRYRATSTAPKRQITFDPAKNPAVILEVARPAVYDPEQLRTNGLAVGAINLTIRFDEET